MSRLTFDDNYLLWLIQKVEIPETICNPKMWDVLYEIQFEVLVSNDTNRVEDAEELLVEYSRSNWNTLPPFGHGGVSVLELLIAFSIRINREFSSEEHSDLTREYFWLMVENLQIKNVDESVIRHKVNTFVSRSYSRTGYGGLFPLKRAKKDQFGVELWYQMMEFMLEKGDI